MDKHTHIHTAGMDRAVGRGVRSTNRWCWSGFRVSSLMTHMKDLHVLSVSSVITLRGFLCQNIKKLTCMFANWTKETPQTSDILGDGEHRGHRRAPLFYSSKMALFLTQPHSILWQSQQVASVAWMESEGSAPTPFNPPPSSVIGRGGRLPPMIRPSAEIVPGKLLSCTSVMLCSPGYLHLISVTEAAVCLSHTENTQDKTSLAGSACYIFNLVS